MRILRFLSTVFVISKEKVFVCHLPASNLYHINTTNKIFKRELKEGNWTKIILVGGHRETDLFANRIKFADEIKSILKSILPGIEIDCSKLNIYKGNKHIKTVKDEIELRKRNTRFVLAIYDSIHNIIITHTEYKNQEVVNDYLINILIDEFKYYSEINLIHGENIRNRYYEFIKGI